MVGAVAVPLDACDGREPPSLPPATSLELCGVNLLILTRLSLFLLSPMASTRSMEAVLRRNFLKFLSDQSGATAIEYGLIAAGISLAIIAVVNGLGTNLNAKFDSINTSLK